MGEQMEILLATSNPGKIKEIKKILSPYGLKLLTLEQFPPLKAPAETGKDFAENARIKAGFYAEKMAKPALADDSGLEVDYLGGGPGIYSSRFAGPEASDAERNQKLLSLLKGVPFPRRRAAFVCVAVLIFPGGKELKTEGRLEGYIATRPMGNEGFGYDPVFFLPEYKKTTAQLGQEKNRISHRFRAFKAMGELISREKS